jgi:hypothetical protein
MLSTIMPVPNDNIRNPIRKYDDNFITANNADIVYNGGCEEYEDIADYIPRSHPVKGVVIA